MPHTTFKLTEGVSLKGSLPEDYRDGLWIGRAWLPASISPSEIAGPHVITVRDSQVVELSNNFTTIASFILEDDPVSALQNATGKVVCEIDELFANSLFFNQPDDISESKTPVLLAPNDIQAIKACGVTFAASMLERVIEERALGDPKKASEIRSLILSVVGKDLNKLEPGSHAAMELKEKLIKESFWSQYMEVGIGPDAEVFTKAQPLSAITTGAQLGILSTSEWNNPEPEIALLITPSGKIIGATLGNDVNLRDYEGRSALLLGKAKDQNGTCSLGPMFRIFDHSFSIDDILTTDVSLTLTGEDGFESHGCNKMNQISRSPSSIVKQVLNRSHQYPDGLVLFLGTMFTPTDDRGEKGQGFTHKIGDRVEISSPLLGKLVNWVNHCDRIPEWRFGIAELIRFLIASQRKNHN